MSRLTLRDVEPLVLRVEIRNKERKTFQIFLLLFFLPALSGPPHFRTSSASGRLAESRNKPVNNSLLPRILLPSKVQNRLNMQPIFLLEKLDVAMYRDEIVLVQLFNPLEYTLQLAACNQDPPHKAVQSCKPVLRSFERIQERDLGIGNIFNEYFARRATYLRGDNIISVSDFHRTQVTLRVALHRHPGGYEAQPAKLRIAWEAGQLNRGVTMKNVG